MEPVIVKPQPSEGMFKLLVQCRAMQMFYHSAHNLASKVAFFGDHSAFGDFYSALEGDYDSVIERAIGTSGPEIANLQRIIAAVHEKCMGCPSTEAKDNKVLFEHSLAMEKELQGIATLIIRSPGTSEGTKNLVAQIADDSESRCYKIKQRIKI
jgi:DNA-binding ferritin-like protein